MIRSAIDFAAPLLGALLAQPAFLGVASLTLSLGMAAGLAAVVFAHALVYGVPPLPGHARVAIYGQSVGDDVPAVSMAAYEAAGMPQGALQRGAARVPEQVNAVFGGHASLAMAQQVDAGFLPTLGLAMPGGSAAGAAGRHVVFVSRDYWRRAMGGQPLAAARPLLVDGVAYPVGGVLPDRYKFFVDVDLLLPMRSLGDADRRAANLVAVARLAPGWTAQRFERGLSARFPRPARVGATPGYRAMPLDHALTRAARPTMLLFLCAAVVVLAVSGTSVAYLLLSRSLARSRDMAIHEALGATRWQGRAPLLVDAVAVWSLAVLLTLPAGDLLVRALRGFVPPPWSLSTLPIVPAATDRMLAVLAGTVVLALAACAGAARQPMDDVLRERVAIDGPSSGGSGARQARWWFVASLAALATALVVPGMSLALRLWGLERIPPGFDASDAIAIALRPDDRRYPTVASVSRLVDDLRAAVLELPGTVFVGMSNHLPVGEGFVMPFRRADGGQAMLQYALLTPEAAQALGLRRHAGRWFTPHDDTTAERVAMVNEAYLRAVDGRGIGGVVRPVSGTAPDSALRIVGVVADTSQAGAAHGPEPTVFVPLAQAGDASFALTRHLMPMYIVLRGASIDASTDSAFDRLLARVAPGLAAGKAVPLAAVARQATAAERRDAWLINVLAAFAVVLAATGMYSVQSVEIVVRRRDLALCGALGARPSRIFGRALALGTSAVPCGIAAGLAAVLLIERRWPAGPIGGDAVALGVFLMASTSLAAIALPSLGVWRTDPIQVLRGD